MTLSTFCALIAALEFVIGLPLLVSPQTAVEWLLRHVKDDVSYRVTGALLVSLGVVVLWNNHDVSYDLAGVIQLLALVTGIKGLVICWWPTHHVTIVERVLSSRAMGRAVGVLALLVAALLAAAAMELR